MPEEQKKSNTWKILLGVGIGCLVLGGLIVALVVALGFVGSRAVKGKVKQAQSVGTVLSVAMALENFRLNHAQYPWPQPAGGAAPAIDPKQVCTELCGLPGAKVNKQANKYVVPAPQTVQGGRFVDAWGNPLEFSLDAKGQPVVRSRGPDGMSGTADDITNWAQE